MAKGYMTHKEQIWKFQRILDGKKSCLRKTYKTQLEANDKVWELSENTEKAWLKYMNVSKPPTKELCEADRPFDTECTSVQKRVHLKAIITSFMK